MRAAGFTLVELLVSLAIVALLIALALPHLPAGLTASEFTGSARELTAALREARSLSLNRNRDVAFTIDRAAGRYGFDGRGSDLAAGIGIALSGSENDVVWFFPDGTASGGRIVLSRDGARIVIAIEEMTGRVNRVDGP